jgi:hypothetical protein
MVKLFFIKVGSECVFYTIFNMGIQKITINIVY